MKNNKGFTLVELMISVAIIGVLAAVAVPAYRKYIINSKVTEGLLELRHIHDRQIIFVNTPITYRDATHGDIQCRSTNRFATACMYIDNDDGLGSWQFVPSLNKTKSRRWHGWPKQHDQIGSVGATGYNPNSNTCQGVGISSYTDPSLLFAGYDYSTGADGKWLWDSIDNSYFTVWAWSNQLLANEAGVSLSETTMLWALSDLDGDYENGFPTEGGARCNKDPRQWDDITKLGRSMYFKDGEIQSGAGILRINIGE